jgi:hypothetical protein
VIQPLAKFVGDLAMQFCPPYLPWQPWAADRISIFVALPKVAKARRAGAGNTKGGSITVPFTS